MGAGEKNIPAAPPLPLSPAQVAWLSLDDGDNDPTCFLTYFIVALQQIDPSIGQTGQSMLHASQPHSTSTETLMTALINKISVSSAGDQRVIVLDDYHVIKEKPIDDALTFLVDHLPSPPGRMHLVIATRDDPHRLAPNIPPNLTAFYPVMVYPLNNEFYFPRGAIQ